MVKMVFDSIEQIKAHQFVGNYHSDSEAFNAIETFVLKKGTSLADQAEALRVMGDKGMGIGRDEHMSDQELVDAYLDDM